MGYNVHLHVCFACDRNDNVANLAKKHLESLGDICREAKDFLRDLSERTGGNSGYKGGLSLWGMTGNYTSAQDFAENLIPFWQELLNGVEGGPLDFEHILIFEEQEQSESTTVYEIGWDEPNSKNRKIFIKKHEGMPFAFMQF